MCRWLAYSGAPLALEELIFRPEHSLIDQSLHPRAGVSTTNGDGFGIGWYSAGKSPGLYKDIRPAWNDRNLRDLATQIESSLFLAHVRAATGTAVQRTNCHPFRHGRWLFMHNGTVEEFRKVKRDLVLEVASEFYGEIEGSTDSEIMFFLALTFGLDDDPIGAVERMAGLVERIGEAKGIEHPLQMSLGFTDGESLIAVRYSTERRSRSLFNSKSVECLKQLNPEFDRFSEDARAIVSEPLTDLGDYWEEVPESTAVVVHDGEVSRQPFQPHLSA